MHELYELKDKLLKELEEYGSKDEMTAGTLEVVDKLAHTVKNLCKIIEEAEYSEAGGSYEGGMTAGGGSYARGGGNRGGGGGSSRAMRGGSYAGGGSYARGGGGGRGGNARRDSMGRYSSAGDFVEDLRELMEEAPDERTRSEIERLVRQMERG